jgi:hypothetical protein
MNDPAPVPGVLAQQAQAGRSIADSLSSREWDQLVDIVVRRMEHRMAADLARRGRRSTPRVF